MNNEEQSQINALLSGLKMKLHAYQTYRDRANAVFNDYVANKKVPHFTPADTAKMRSVVYLSEIEYEHAISIVDDVERFFNHVIEYANLNCQAGYNAAPDANGYRQGGLGDGVTTLSSASWSSFNNYNPFIPCGYTSSLGNRTGIIDFAMPAEYGAALTVRVPSYRGLENPFGHVWSWTDGCKCRIQSDDGGGLSEFYTCGEPDKFQDSSYDDYGLRGNLPRASGYVKELLVGEYGENMPKVASGASSTTYFCDNFYTAIPASGEALWGVLFGGYAYSGAPAGFACAYANYAASYAATNVGSRLCFIPA